jgi:hypothetical protein
MGLATTGFGILEKVWLPMSVTEIEVVVLDLGRPVIEQAELEAG